MDIKFLWSGAADINPSLKQSAELEIGELIDQEADTLKPCHSGPISVSLSPDPINFVINGVVTCECGKTLASVDASTQGSNITSINLHRPHPPS